MNDKKKIVPIIGIVITIVIMVFIIEGFIANWNNIKPYLINMRHNWFVFSLVAYAGVFILSAYNWACLPWVMDSSVNKIEYMNIHMISALARYIPGGMWNIVGKAYLCSKNGVGKSATTAAIIMEYVFQIASSALFLVFFMPIPIYNRLGLAGILGMTIFILLLLVLMPTGIRLGTRFICKFFKNEDDLIALDNKSVYIIMIRFTLVWIITGISLIILVNALMEVELLQGMYLILSYPVAWCAGFLSPAPNGIGIREAVLGFLLSSRYNYELLFLITLTSRIWTILGEVVAFVLFKMVYLMLKKWCVLGKDRGVQFEE